MEYAPYAEAMEATGNYRAIQDVEGVGHAIDMANGHSESGNIADIPTVCDSGITRDPYTVGILITCWKCISILA